MFNDKELKYLKNIVTILNKAKFEIEGSDILPMASSMTVLQTSIIPKIEQIVKDNERKQSLATAKSPVKEPAKKGRKAKVGK